MATTSRKLYTCIVASTQLKRKWRRAVAAQIRMLRKIVGLTQEELSERAGIAPHYLSRLENAHQSPSLDKLVDIADALGTTPHALLGAPEGVEARIAENAVTEFGTLTGEDGAFLESQISAWTQHIKSIRRKL